MSSVKPWQVQQRNDKLAMELLGWTELKVAQSSHEEITTALAVHRNAALLQKQKLPPVTAPEVVVKLTCLQNSPVAVRPPAHRHTPTPRKVLVVAKTPPPLRIATPSPPSAVNKTPPAVAPAQQEMVIGKTPGFMRDHTDTQLTEESCTKLIQQLKELQKRRCEHEILLANPNLVEVGEIEKSFERTNKYIKDCLKRMWMQKEQIATALQTKKSLAMWADAATEPETLASLTTDVAKLISLLKILNLGLNPS